eukprot:5042496-Prymnesium_polylepis.1
MWLAHACRAARGSNPVASSDPVASVGAARAAHARARERTERKKATRRSSRDRVSSCAFCFGSAAEPPCMPANAATS